MISTFYFFSILETKMIVFLPISLMILFSTLKNQGWEKSVEMINTGVIFYAVGLILGHNNCEFILLAVSAFLVSHYISAFIATRKTIANCSILGGVLIYDIILLVPYCYHIIKFNEICLSRVTLISQFVLSILYSISAYTLAEKNSIGSKKARIRRALCCADDLENIMYGYDNAVVFTFNNNVAYLPTARLSNHYDFERKKWCLKIEAYPKDIYIYVRGKLK